ncbi:MAG: hypothetical protein M1826_004530 [Phylliscum demangeonii]|nr:MAG: hypothetical protein M1826_004530 [Phylliscum demangeonii]
MTPVDVNSESWSTSPRAAGPSLTYSPYTNLYQATARSPASHPLALKPPSYPAGTALPPSYAMSELRSHGPPLPPAPLAMPPPSSAPGGANALSLSAMAPSARDYYATSTPYLSKHSLPMRGPLDLLSSSPRSPLSMSGRGGPPPGAMRAPSLNAPYPGAGATEPSRPEPTVPSALAGTSAGPPLDDTLLLYQMTTADGQMVRPEIQARIDKGFFLHDQDWTCYRRNYFSVACSYTLKPASARSAPLYLNRSDAMGAPARIGGFAMSISAAVDDAAGKPVDLIQHTPKRDKGPLLRPDRVRLAPQLDGALTLFPAAFASGRIQHEYDQGNVASGPEPQTVAHFERIQFKSATANNGKRRAAQQYYHLVVDLFADLGASLGPEGRWVKVAKRVSAQVVVRGRSPGHYQDDRRGSASSVHPAGPSVGDYGNRAHQFHGLPGVGRGPGDAGGGVGGLGPILGGGGGGGGYHGPGGYPYLRSSIPSLESLSASRSPSSTEGSDPNFESVDYYPPPPLMSTTFPGPPLEVPAGHVALSGGPGCHRRSVPFSPGYGASHEALYHGSAPSSQPADGTAGAVEYSAGIPWHLGSGAVRDHLRMGRLPGSKTLERGPLEFYSS